ncbi:hypothetical protein ACI799_07990 [Blastococcus sp. SYSU DS0753]
MYLDELRISHLPLYRLIAEVDQGQLFMTDLVLLPILQRSYGLVEGFSDAFDSHNLAAVAPLVRLQLDSLFRVHYIANASSADEISGALVRGQEFRHMRDGKQKLTDGRLKDLAAKDHPWASRMYDRTSGWVHFSPAHIAAAWQIDKLDNRPGAISGGLPYRPGTIPAGQWLELLDALIQATVDLFEYLWQWSARKGLPPGEVREVPRPWPERSADERLLRLTGGPQSVMGETSP